MNLSKPSKPIAKCYLTIMLSCALGAACMGAIRSASYKNKQTIMRNMIQKTEDQIRAIYQDDIPSIKSKIDQSLASHRAKERLQAQNSDFVPGLTEQRYILRANSQSSIKP